jgi:hypothetical protein
MATLIVCWNRNVDEFNWRVRVTESDDRNVDIAGLLDSLSIGSRIGDNNQAGFLERASDVVGEVSWGKAASNSHSSRVSGEFENSSLAIGASRNHTDVSGVIDGDNDASSEDNLFPRLGMSK